jgi:hypothetical protein
LRLTLKSSPELAFPFSASWLLQLKPLCSAMPSPPWQKFTSETGSHHNKSFLPYKKNRSSARSMAQVLECLLSEWNPWVQTPVLAICGGSNL